MTGSYTFLYRCHTVVSDWNLKGIDRNRATKNRFAKVVNT